MPHSNVINVKFAKKILSNKERQQKFRDKNKNNIAFKEYKRLAEKRRRDKLKLENCAVINNRQQSKIRMRKMRALHKERLKSNEKQTEGSFKNRSSLGRAMKRVNNSLPKSECRRKEVIVNLARSVGLHIPTKSNSLKISEETITIVSNFYARQEHTWTSPNIRTVSRSGRQRQFMLMTIKELYAMFRKEFPSIKIGKSMFAQYRPSYVDTMNNIPFEQCLCKHHENFSLICKCLGNSGLVPFVHYAKDMKSLIRDTSCDENSYNCTFGFCGNCSNTHTMVNLFKEANMEQSVSLEQWKTVDKAVIKNAEDVRLSTVVGLFQEKFASFKQHCYVNEVQKTHFKNLRDSLDDYSAVFQFDFAENFCLKQQREIQSAYFTNQQVSIFTAVAWVKGAIESFAIVSDTLSHDKVAVFTYLNEIFEFIKSKYTNIKVVNIFSDGSAAQFKQRFTLSTLPIHAARFQFATINWHYFATSHGKGAVDGIGGTIKCHAWKKIKSNKCCITNAESFCNAVSDLKINTLLVHPSLVNNNTQLLESYWQDIPLMDQIQKFHCYCYTSSDPFFTYMCTSSSGNICYYNFSDSMIQFLHNTIFYAKFKIGDTVIVNYSQHKRYPGIVTLVTFNQIQIKSMLNIGGNKWIWPEKECNKFYDISEVEQINSTCLVPCGTSKRISHYEVNHPQFLSKVFF